MSEKSGPSFENHDLTETPDDTIRRLAQRVIELEAEMERRDFDIQGAIALHMEEVMRLRAMVREARAGGFIWDMGSNMQTVGRAAPGVDVTDPNDHGVRRNNVL